jgi:hypothetical protein
MIAAQAMTDLCMIRDKCNKTLNHEEQPRGLQSAQPDEAPAGARRAADDSGRLGRVRAARVSGRSAYSQVAEVDPTGGAVGSGGAWHAYLLEDDRSAIKLRRREREAPVPASLARWRRCRHGVGELSRLAQTFGHYTAPHSRIGETAHRRQYM